MGIPRPGWDSSVVFVPRVQLEADGADLPQLPVAALARAIEESQEAPDALCLSP